MYISTKNPFKNIDLIANRMNAIGNEIFNSLDNGITIEKAGSFNPRIDILEDNSFFTALVELPGLKREDFSVNINEEGLLTIKGNKSRYELKEEQKARRTERNFGEFYRSFQLSELADLEKVNAKFENGLLELTIAKKEPVKPKEILVNIN